MKTVPGTALAFPKTLFCLEAFTHHAKGGNMNVSLTVRWGVVACALFFLVGCGSAQMTAEGEIEGLTTEEEPGTPGDIAEVSDGLEIEANALLTGIDDAVAATGQTKALGLNIPYDIEDLLRYFGDYLRNAKYLLKFEKVKYYSVDEKGDRVKLSGLLILPVKLFKKPSVPIISYQHATEIFREYAPSVFLDNPLDVLHYPEVIVAAAMASSGYAVAMADYQGMGDSLDVQPYCHGDTLARQVVDMLKASEKRISKPWSAGKLGSPVKWNGKLFLMGYSEGGYVTMAATRELQEKHAGTFPVTASAPLSGPHDISGTMRDIMIADETYKEPFFLPFVISGFGTVYEHATDPVIAALFEPENVYRAPFHATLPPLMDGNTPSSEINAAMGMSENPLEFIVPRSVLKDDVVADMQDEDSALVAVLRENDSYRGWVPQMRLRMYHHVDDELVPHENSAVAHEAFVEAGAPRVELIDVDVNLNVEEHSTDTVHAFASLPELHDAWIWFKGM